MDDIDEGTPFGARTGSSFDRLAWRIADAPIFPAEWRRKLRKRMAGIAPGPFDCDLQGLKFRLYPGENYCDRVIWARGTLPEEAEHRALDPYLRPGMTFIDIGANIGTYSLYVAGKAGPSARILALEPHPRTFRKLAFNIKANDAAAVEPVQAAVAPERGNVRLWSDGGRNIGHSSLEKAGTSNPKLSVEVAALPLLDLAVERDIDRIDLIKIDVEGFEDRALLPFFRAAPETLWPKALLIETVHGPVWQEDCMAFLREAGYRPAFATAENQLLVYDPAADADQAVAPLAGDAPSQ